MCSTPVCPIKNPAREDDRSKQIECLSEVSPPNEGTSWRNPSPCLYRTSTVQVIPNKTTEARHPRGLDGTTVVCHFTLPSGLCSPTAACLRLPLEDPTLSVTLCKLFHRSLSVLLSCTCRDVSWSIWFLCVSWGFVINLILVHDVRFRDQFDSCTCCEVSWSIRFYVLSIVRQVMAVTCFPSNHVPNLFLWFVGLVLLFPREEFEMPYVVCWLISRIFLICTQKSSSSRKGILVSYSNM